ncbi:hypothetical protein KR093_005040 [Drosophila rubida]|uniref:[histone H3]-lysine(36) N-trimethyltransferase n=1 Tax=Drosophila rubida TaxID=30044 RepID=A0AAD4KA09_9MUSC|nr:hypothetical protein KR093_005040 [Drosophila rubida]
MDEQVKSEAEERPASPSPSASSSPKPCKRFDHGSNNNNNASKASANGLKPETKMQTAAVEMKAEDVSSASNQYRRSTRKKIKKFDVCDLLKKDRRNRKTKIESLLSFNIPAGTNAAPNEMQIAARKQSQPLPRDIANYCMHGRIWKQPRVRLKDMAFTEIGRAAVARYNKRNNSISSGVYSDTDSNSKNSTTGLSEDAASTTTTCSKPKTKLRVLIKRMPMPLSGGCNDDNAQNASLDMPGQEQLQDVQMEEESAALVSVAKTNEETEADTKTEMIVDDNYDSYAVGQQAETVEATQILTKKEDEPQSVINDVELLDVSASTNNMILEAIFAQIAVTSSQSIQKTELQNTELNRSNYNIDLSLNRTYDNNSSNKSDLESQNKVPEKTIALGTQQVNNKASDPNVTETVTALINIPKPNQYKEAQQLNVPLTAESAASVEWPATATPCIPAVVEQKLLATTAAGEKKKPTDESLTATEATTIEEKPNRKRKKKQPKVDKKSTATKERAHKLKNKSKPKSKSKSSKRAELRSKINLKRLKHKRQAETKPRTRAQREKNVDRKAESKSEANAGLPTPTADLDAEEMGKFIKTHDNGKASKQTSSEDFALLVANMETPATTPGNSPQHNIVESPFTTDSSVGGGAVRRSHRIKRKRPAAAAGKLHCESNGDAPALSMVEQLAQLSNMDFVNEQFMRHEGLNTFQLLRDNYYRCARQVSQENAEMQCDCEDAQLDHQCCGNGCINRLLMIECGPLCSNGQRCTNKRFQLHQCWPCRVFRTEKKGCGITAEISIAPGVFIMEYVGEVIDSEEFERRQHLYSLDRNRHYYFMALRGEAIIDATAKGNISRYINHSCDPNAETQKWTVNGELRIGFFSVKRIEAGEEITFDYQYQRYGRDAQRCYCEASNCRGWIGGEPDAAANEGEQLVDDMEEQQPEAEQQQQQMVEEESYGVKSKLRKSSNKSRPKSAKHSSRKSRAKPKDREYKAGRWLRPSCGVDAATTEDPDVLEQLSLLRRSGLKNQADTLRFSRCMVRAKLQPSRVQLLQLLTRGELPCRRLFLDYHGLRLLHAWISDSRHAHDVQLRSALLDALDALPIPNRTLLTESHVYQCVQSWSSLSAPAASHQQQLLHKWSTLPEIYRIPKRERIEQMKAHERAADGHATTALEDSHSNRATAASDPYRQDRFRRDQPSSSHSRYDKFKQLPRPSTHSHFSSGQANGAIEGHNAFKADARRRGDPRSNRTMSKELRRSLFERKVAQDEAEKRNFFDEQIEHEMRCKFFGADASTDSRSLPFYQNIQTKQWFNRLDEPVATPKCVGDAVDYSASSCSSSEAEGLEEEVDETGLEKYKLPPDVESLPLSWTWNKTDDGTIYYYHLRDRVPQWEPPNAEQRKQRLVDDLPISDKEEMVDPNALIDIDEKIVSTMDEQQLTQYIEEKAEERRKLRLERLASVRTFTPDEELSSSQLEARSYRNNKELMRLRMDAYPSTADAQLRELYDIPHSYNYWPEDEASGSLAQLSLGDGFLASLPLTIPQPEPEPQPQPASAAKQDNANDQLSVEPSTSSKAAAQRSLSDLPTPQLPYEYQEAVDNLLNMRRQLMESYDKTPDMLEKKPPRARYVSCVGKKESDKFRSEISVLVAEYLRPYCMENCQMGHITSEEDYQYLINRLSHHITNKEMRFCDSNGTMMTVSDSVKYKSYEFIKDYMYKKGPVYKKPAYDLDH